MEDQNKPNILTRNDNSQTYLEAGKVVMQCSDNDVKFSDGGVVLLCCHVTCSSVVCCAGRPPDHPGDNRVFGVNIGVKFTGL